MQFTYAEWKQTTRLKSSVDWKSRYLSAPNTVRALQRDYFLVSKRATRRKGKEETKELSATEQSALRVLVERATSSDHKMHSILAGHQGQSATFFSIYDYLTLNMRVAGKVCAGGVLPKYRHLASPPLVNVPPNSSQTDGPGGNIAGARRKLWSTCTLETMPYASSKALLVQDLMLVLADDVCSAVALIVPLLCHLILIIRLHASSLMCLCFSVKCLAEVG